MTLAKINPIIVREMRGRMRGRRAFIVLTIYLMLMSCMAGSIYTLIYSENVSYNPYGLGAPAIEFGPVIGKSIFSGTVLFLLTIISFIAPGFTAGAISGEREQQTYEVLLTTPMRPIQIVWGKLGSVFTFLLLIILASLPIQSLAFLFGGVAPPEVFIGALGLIVTAFTFGALGLFISSLTRTTMASIIITYALGLPFVYGLPLILFYIGGMLTSVFNIFNDPSPLFLVILVYGLGFIASINPFGAAILTATVAANGKGYFIFQETFDTVTLWFISPWIIYVGFYTLFSVFLFWLTVRNVGRISNK